MEKAEGVWQKQKETGRHLWDVLLKSAPLMMCFLLPQGLERVMCNMLLSSQLRANSGTIWRHSWREGGGTPGTQQTHPLSFKNCVYSGS